jgi:cell division septum initiation protein DivIVA
MDILYLVDRLEALITKGGHVPLSAKTMVDEDEFLDIIDQMRIAIPEEIKQARKLLNDRERIIAQAKEEADHITLAAREDAARLTNEHAIGRAAQERSQKIEEKARAEAVALRAGADSYAAETLTEVQAQLQELAKHLASLQDQVDNGLNYLVQQRLAPAEPPELEEKVS